MGALAAFFARARESVLEAGHAGAVYSLSSGESAQGESDLYFGGGWALYKKLDWLNEVVSDEHRTLAYLPMLDDYLRDLERRFDSGEGLPGEESVLLERIQFNREAKERVTGILQTPIRGLVRERVYILNFAKRVGWYDEETYGLHLKELLGGTFQYNLTQEQKESICSMGVSLDLRPEELPQEEWNSSTVFALGCVRPLDTRIHRLLAGLLATAPVQVRKAALWALGESGTEDPKIHGEVVAALGKLPRGLRSWAARALVKMNPQDLAVYQSLAKLLKDPGLNSEITWILEKIRLKESGVTEFWWSY